MHVRDVPWPAEEPTYSIVSVSSEDLPTEPAAAPDALVALPVEEEAATPVVVESDVEMAPIDPDPSDPRNETCDGQTTSKVHDDRASGDVDDAAPMAVGAAPVDDAPHLSSSIPEKAVVPASRPIAEQKQQAQRPSLKRGRASSKTSVLKKFKKRVGFKPPLKPSLQRNAEAADAKDDAVVSDEPTDVEDNFFKHGAGVFQTVGGKKVEPSARGRKKAASICECTVGDHDDEAVAGAARDCVARPSMRERPETAKRRAVVTGEENAQPSRRTPATKPRPSPAMENAPPSAASATRFPVPAKPTQPYTTPHRAPPTVPQSAPIDGRVPPPPCTHRPATAESRLPEYSRALADSGAPLSRASKPSAVSSTPRTLAYDTTPKSTPLPSGASVTSVVAKVTAANADSVRFNGATGTPISDASGGLGVAEVALNLVMKHQLKPELLRQAADGTADTAAWRAWVRNHYRWVVWKLAAQERSWDGARGRLTYKAVVEQLAHRFDREVNQAQKPALKAILQRDAASERLVVLCVSAIDEARSELELTDGWYSVRASMDEALAFRVSRRAIRVGVKLAICGARLDGAAADPLDVLAARETHGVDDETTSQLLRLPYNGTRLARWDARLGFLRTRCMTVALHSIVVGQGRVPSFDAVVVRVALPPEADEIVPSPPVSQYDDDVANESDDDRRRAKPATPTHDACLRLRAPGKTDRQRPVTVVLRLRSPELVDGGDGVREGDLIRVVSSEAWRTNADSNGTIDVRVGPRTRFRRLASPAARHAAAAAWYEPRSLVGGSRAAALLRDKNRCDDCVDVAGVVLEITDDTLYLFDDAPTLLAVALPSSSDDTPELCRARRLQPRGTVAILNVTLGHSSAVGVVACEWTADARVCTMPARLDQASRASTSRAFVLVRTRQTRFRAGLRDDFDRLQRWARGAPAARALIDAQEQLGDYRGSKTLGLETTPAQQQRERRRRQEPEPEQQPVPPANIAEDPSTTTPSVEHIEKALVQALEARAESSEAATRTELRLELACGTSETADILDAVIEKLQVEGVVYISDADHVCLL